jgi:hypothetical protein
VILMDSAGGVIARDEPARSAFVQLGRLDGTRIDRFDYRAREILNTCVRSLSQPSEIRLWSDPPR